MTLPPSVLQRQQARAGEVGVIGLHGLGDVAEAERTVGLVRQRLGLDAAQHGGAAAFQR